MAPKVFLSYRRNDSPHASGRLRDRLTRDFGEDNVFYDVDSIPAGRDFRDVIREAIRTADTVVVMIGPGFDADRLSDQRDFVRIELLEAFRQKKVIVPVLIDPASMPVPAALPSSLRPLAFINALPIRQDPDFHRDCERLIAALRRTSNAGGLASGPALPGRPPSSAELTPGSEIAEVGNELAISKIASFPGPPDPAQRSDEASTRPAQGVRDAFRRFMARLNVEQGQTPQPRYRMIAEDLRAKIESGELAPGSQLATELQLQEQYESSRNTVRAAITFLSARGLVYTRPGQGTFVVKKLEPLTVTLSSGQTADASVEAVEGGREPQATVPRVEMQQASGWVAERLHIAEGASVVSRHQATFLDEMPWSLQTSFYPMELVQRGASKLIQSISIPDGATRYIEKTLSIKQGSRRDEIKTRVPDLNEASFFKLPEDGRVAVFEVSHTAFDERGNPFRLSITIYPADRVHVAYEEAKLPPVKRGGRR